MKRIFTYGIVTTLLVALCVQVSNAQTRLRIRAHQVMTINDSDDVPFDMEGPGGQDGDADEPSWRFDLSAGYRLSNTSIAPIGNAVNNGCIHYDNKPRNTWYNVSSSTVTTNGVLYDEVYVDDYACSGWEDVTFTFSGLEGWEDDGGGRCSYDGGDDSYDGAAQLIIYELGVDYDASNINLGSWNTLPFMETSPSDRFKFRFQFRVDDDHAPTLSSVTRTSNSSISDGGNPYGANAFCSGVDFVNLDAPNYNPEAWATAPDYKWYVKYDGGSWVFLENTGSISQYSFEAAHPGGDSEVGVQFGVRYSGASCDSDIVTDGITYQIYPEPLTDAQVSINVEHPQCSDELFGQITVDLPSLDNSDYWYGIFETSTGVPAMTGNPNPTDGVFTGVFPGTHIILIRPSGGGCYYISAPVEVYDPPAPISVTLGETTAPHCAGGGDGTIAINYSGGGILFDMELYDPATGQWQIASYNQMGGTFTYQGLASGAGYKVRLTDFWGCQGLLENITVPSTQLPEVSINSIEVVDDCHVSADSIPKGQIFVHAEHGYPPYNYTLIDPVNGNATNSTGVFQGLPPSTAYRVEVVDSEGCSIESSDITLGTQPPFPVDPYYISGPKCSSNAIAYTNDKLGQVNFGVPYNAGYFTSVDGGQTFTQHSFVSLNEGLNQLLVINPDGCLSDTLEFMSVSPPDMTLALDSLEPARAVPLEVPFQDGPEPVEYSPYQSFERRAIAHLRATGGTGDYQFTFQRQSWAPDPEDFSSSYGYYQLDETITQQVQDTWGDTNIYSVVTSSLSQMFDFNENYLIQYRDSEGCKSPYFYITPDELYETAAWDVSYDGWGGVYATDSLLYQYNDYLQYVLPSSYYCEGVEDTTQLLDTTYVVDDAPPVVEFSQWKDTICPGETFMITIPAPAQSFTPDAQHLDTFEYSMDMGMTWQDSPVFEVAAGEYFPMVRSKRTGVTRKYVVAGDDVFAVQLETVSCNDGYYEYASDVPNFQVDVSTADPSCANDEFASYCNGATIIGYPGPILHLRDYYYTYVPTKYDTLLTGIPENIPADNIPAPLYDWDSLPIAAQEYHHSLGVPPVVIVGSNAMTVTAVASGGGCSGSGTASIIVSVDGGRPEYGYSLDNMNFQSDSIFTGVSDGTYTVHVTDALGCDTVSVDVAVSSATFALQILNQADVSCFGSEDGTVSFTPVISNDELYQYSIDGGANYQPSPDFTGLPAGDYTGVILGDQGCTDTIPVITIDEPVELTVGAGISTPLLCSDDNNAVVTATANGSSTYQYSMDGGLFANSPTFTNLGAGSYMVEVLDNQTGCSAQTTVDVTAPDAISVEINIDNNISCAGANDGAVSIWASGGTGTFEYSSDNGATYQSSNVFSNLGSGNIFIVRDANGCTYAQPFDLDEPVGMVLSLTPNDGTCSGDGSILSNVTGGTGTLSYAWSNTEASAGISGLSGGIYTLTVTDENNCAVSESATINALGIDPTTTDLSCGATDNGQIEVAILTGTPPYSYSIDNGATTQSSPTFSNLAAGTYHILVTDATNCSASETVSLTTMAGLQLNLANVSDVSCNGAMDGAAEISVTGGQAPFLYSMDGVAFQGNAVFDNLGVTNGYFYVQDAGGCLDSILISITEPDMLQANLTASTTDCADPNGGVITSMVTGGTAPYTYEWSNASTTENLGSLPAGDYTLTLTDSNGCQITATTSTSVMTVSATANDPTCNSGNDGSVSLTVSDGVAPYSYSIDGGVNFQDSPGFTGLSAGDYGLIVQDADMCAFNLSVTLNEPLPIAVNVVETSGPSCLGDMDGSIEIAGADGQAPYQYSQDGINYSISGLFNNLGAGDYTFYIQDANGCTSQSAPITLNEPIALSIALEAYGMDCTIPNSGVIEAIVTGGTAPYTYNWSNAGNTATINGLATDAYTLTVTDANACTATASAATPAALQAMYALYAPLCHENNDGHISITAIGGNPPYAYSIDNGATMQDTPIFDNLGSGSYTVRITDNEGCLIFQTLTLDEPGALDVQVLDTQMPNCQGDGDGRMEVQAVGGTPPYQYSLDGNSYSFSGLFQNLTAGSYTVFIQDGNDCMAQSSPITLGEPDALSLVITEVSPEVCQSGNGVLEVTPSGGTSPYDYEWDGNATLDNNILDNAGAGMHTVVVTDGNGCTASASTTLTGNNDLPQITLLQNINSNCGQSDGVLEVEGSGGEGPYNYTWSHDATLTGGLAGNLAAGGYMVTVTDNNGCGSSASFTVGDNGVLSILAEAASPDACGLAIGSAGVDVLNGSSPFGYIWDNGEMTADAISLSAGTHFVTVTDGSGCQAIGQVDISEAPSLGMTAEVGTPSCAELSDGGIGLTVTGGTMPYSYIWNAPGNPSTSEIDNLPIGTYTVTVTDINGCSLIESFDLQTAPLTINTLQVVQPLCGEATGGISVEGLGGTPPYSYGWSDLGTTSSVSGLAVGGYTVTVTDGNGCSLSENFTLSSEDLVIDVVTIIQPICGGSGGSVTLTVSGGEMPYDYVWSNVEETPNLDNLAEGTYTLTVTDANNCEATFEAVLESVEATLAVVNLTQPDCGNMVGQIEVEALSGTPPFEYVWSNGSAEASNDNLAAGTYTVTLTDAAGCVDVGTYVLEGFALSIDTIQILAPDCQQPVGLLEVAATGGVPPFGYLWSDGGTDAVHGNLPAGGYTVTVTDAADCSQTATFNLAPVAGLSIDLGPDTTICSGTALVLDAGDAPDSFVWEDEMGIITNTETLEVSEEGVYRVNGVSPSGCEGSDTIEVSVSADILSANFLMASEAVAGDTVVAIEVSFPLPDTVHWFFEDDEVAFVKDTLNQRWFHFPDAGVYTIAMEVNSGDCIDYIEKQITIVADSSQLTGQVVGFTEILDFSLYPNPSDGQFSVEVELSAPQPVALRLYDLDSDPLDFKEGNASSNHLFNYDLPNLPNGGYVLVLQTPSETRHLNLIIIN